MRQAGIYIAFALVVGLLQAACKSELEVHKERSSGQAGGATGQVPPSGGVETDGIAAQDGDDHLRHDGENSGDVTKLGDGTVDNTEFGFLDGVTASLQAQIDGKLDAEVDPKVGTLANGKWCSSDGIKINCTEAPPTPGNLSYGSSAGAPAAAVFVDDAGNVGIGRTPNPSYRLDVAAPGVVVVGRFGDGSGAASLTLDGASGFVRDLGFQSNGVNRWIFRTESSAEGGANSGSNLEIVTRKDDGSFLGVPLAINRAAGFVGIGQRYPTAPLHVSNPGGPGGVDYKYQHIGGQGGDWRRSVILLHAAYDATLLNQNYAIGTIFASRGGTTEANRLEVAEVATQSGYNANAGTLRSLGNFAAQKWRLVTVRYGGVLYVGVELPPGAARLTQATFIGFHTSTAADSLKIVDYYDSNAATVLNAEVNGSIATLTALGKHYVDASVYSVSGNLGVGTVAAPNSSLQVAGAIATAVATKSGAYTLTMADSVIRADASGGGVTITLPTAAGIAGRQYTVKRVNAGGSNAVVAATSGQTIDGAATYTLSAQYQHVSVVSDGANWMIVGNN